MVNGRITTKKIKNKKTSLKIQTVLINIGIVSLIFNMYADQNVGK